MNTLTEAMAKAPLLENCGSDLQCSREEASLVETERFHAHLCYLIDKGHVFLAVESVRWLPFDNPVREWVEDWADVWGRWSGPVRDGLYWGAA